MKYAILGAILLAINYVAMDYLIEEAIEYGKEIAKQEQVSWGWGYAMYTECEVTK